MQAALIVVLVLLGASLGESARAHGGGLDRYGCHNNRRTGDYHCHRAPALAPAPAPRQFSAAPAPSTSRDLVIAAQTLLNHLGCDAGEVDGRMGSRTTTAISRFNATTAGDPTATMADARLFRRLAEAVAAGRRC